MDTIEKRTEPDKEAVRQLLIQWVNEKSVLETELCKLEQDLALSPETCAEFRRRLGASGVRILPDCPEEWKKDPVRVRQYIEDRRGRPLNEEDWEYVYLRFGLDRGKVRTLKEMAEHMGVTRDRVRRKDNCILRRRRISRKPIRDFYG